MIDIVRISNRLAASEPERLPETFTSIHFHLLLLTGIKIYEFGNAPPCFFDLLLLVAFLGTQMGLSVGQGPGKGLVVGRTPSHRIVVLCCNFLPYGSLLPRVGHPLNPMKLH